MIIPIEKVNNKLIGKFSKEIFIYPTDTIYGIGCNAENSKLVKKIRRIKNRDKKPFSIIAPSTNYILKNFETNVKTINKYLPGKYTLLLKKKDRNFLKHVSDNEYMGIRIPKHPLTKILQKTKKPIITTSVNLSGKKPANSIKEVDKDIIKKVDFIVDSGTLSGNPSKIIKKEKIIEG